MERNLLTKINEQFNHELQMQIEGTLNNEDKHTVVPLNFQFLLNLHYFPLQ